MLTKECARHVILEIINLYPDAIPTMRYENPFQLMVGVILSVAFDQSMINFGREVCQPRNQKCENFTQLYACLDIEP